MLPISTTIFGLTTPVDTKRPSICIIRIRSKLEITETNSQARALLDCDK